MLRTIDDELEATRRLTARHVVWDKLFAGWDEPINLIYADVAPIWLDQPGLPSWERSLEYWHLETGVSEATLMFLAEKCVGPQRPGRYCDSSCSIEEFEELYEELYEDWNVAFCADRFEPTIDNIDAAAYQIAIIGDLGAVRHFRPVTEREVWEELVRRVIRYQRQSGLPWLPNEWWDIHKEIDEPDDSGWCYPWEWPTVGNGTTVRSDATTVSGNTSAASRR